MRAGTRFGQSTWYPKSLQKEVLGGVILVAHSLPLSPEAIKKLLRGPCHIDSKVKCLVPFQNVLQALLNVLQALPSNPRKVPLQGAKQVSPPTSLEGLA